MVAGLGFFLPTASKTLNELAQGINVERNKGWKQSQLDPHAPYGDKLPGWRVGHIKAAHRSPIC